MAPFANTYLFIPAWISNDTLSNVWDEIVYLFPNGTAVEIWEWIISFILHHVMDVITYPRYD